jgi:BirA family transcriptional regulator, biotin operon repressor / biotin---[acetyl-CoA-carboxylase] ligase
LVNQTEIEVNEMKREILALLQKTDQALSGQMLSAQLGISRVAVWKHVHQMQNAGVQIDSTAKGYRLISVPDTPWPWLLGERGERVHFFPELPSTMTKAMEMARRGCPAFTVVVAERQEQGRGRLDRRWQSAPGGLYFTIVLRPEIALASIARVHLAAALDMAVTLKNCFGIEAGVKWPNDVLVGERKIAGILSQMEAEPDRIAFINVGIGINVNNPPPKETAAVSIQQLIGRPASRILLLCDFLERFERRIHSGLSTEVASEWKRLSMTLGREVCIQTTRETVHGRAVDLDPDGALIVQAPCGELRSVIHGDCFHQTGFDR